MYNYIRWSLRLEISHMPLTLLVVGMQRDKLSAMNRGGEAAINRTQLKRSDRSDSICGEVNKCIDYATKNGWCVTFAMDMHHSGHPSFDGHGGALRPHCVLRTMGYDPPTGLRFGEMGMDVVYRGMEAEGDSADAFWVITGKCGSRLQGLLSSEGIVLCGTSPDGCIENTLATAKKRGIPTFIVPDAVWTLGAVDEGVSAILDLSSTGSC